MRFAALWGASVMGAGLAVAFERNHAPWLLRIFERSIADGEQFHVGETVQIGRMLTKPKAVTDDLLCITEPDMQALPIKFIDSVDMSWDGQITGRR